MSRKNKQKDNRKTAARKNNIESRKIIQEEKKIIPANEETNDAMKPQTPVWLKKTTDWLEKKTGIRAISLKTLLTGVFCQIVNRMALSTPAPEDVPVEVWATMLKLLIFLGDFIFYTGVSVCLYEVLSFIIKKIKNKKKETTDEKTNN